MSVVNLESYKIFCEVVKAGSLTRASENLYITIPAVSRRIKSIEQTLNTQLFYRENDGVKLTRAGKELFELVNKNITTIDLAEKLIMQKNELDNAEISIACQSHISAYFLLDCITRAKMDYPNLKINLVSEADSMAMTQMLDEHKIDFVIDIVEIDRTNIVIEELKTIENIFVSKEKVNIKDIKEIEELQCILNFDNTISTNTLEKVLDQYKVNLKSTLFCDATEVRVQMAKNSLGIAYVMKDAVVNELKTGELHEVKIGIELPSQKLNLMYLEGQLTKADENFIKQYIRK